MRYLIMLLALSVSAMGNSYVFSKDGATVLTGPRDLPSVGVRLDDGKAVLGLHGSTDATLAACGWYRIVPDQSRAAAGQIVSGRSYAIGKNTAQETLSFATKITVTPEQRLAQIFYAMPGTNDDARVTALIRAVASCVTSKVDSTITVVIPAKIQGTK